jgi:hypothetical protein
MLNEWKRKNHVLPSVANDESKIARPSLYFTFLWAVTKIGIILGFIYICDRTNIFAKHTK